MTDWSEDGFPFATSREVVLAGAFARATRMTYVGELGWELMVPVADAGAVYDATSAAGADLGLTDAGYHAIESLRLEKGYRAFPRELNPDLTPVEAGLLFATALGARAGSDKDFLGRAALAGPSRAPRRRWPPPPRRVVRAGGPGADALGRRAGAARRRAGGPGHQRGVRRDRRRLLSGSRCSAPTVRPPGRPRRRRRSRSTSPASGTPRGSPWRHRCASGRQHAAISWSCVWIVGSF